LTDSRIAFVVRRLYFPATHCVQMPRASRCQSVPQLQTAITSPVEGDAAPSQVPPSPQPVWPSTMEQPGHPARPHILWNGSPAYNSLSLSLMKMEPSVWRHPISPGGEEAVGHLTHKSDDAPNGRYLAKPSSHLNVHPLRGVRVDGREDTYVQVCVCVSARARERETGGSACARACERRGSEGVTEPRGSKEVTHDEEERKASLLTYVVDPPPQPQQAWGAVRSRRFWLSNEPQDDCHPPP